jgi:hypothetical protein
MPSDDFYADDASDGEALPDRWAPIQAGDAIPEVVVNSTDLPEGLERQPLPPVDEAGLNGWTNDIKLPLPRPPDLSGLPALSTYFDADAPPLPADGSLLGPEADDPTHPFNIRRNGAPQIRPNSSEKRRDSSNTDSRPSNDQDILSPPAVPVPKLDSQPLEPPPPQPRTLPLTPDDEDVTPREDMRDIDRSDEVDPSIWINPKSYRGDSHINKAVPSDRPEIPKPGDLSRKKLPPQLEPPWWEGGEPKMERNWRSRHET